MALAAVFGDKNDHGNGDLICDNNDKVFISGKKVAILNSTALSDDLGHEPTETEPLVVSSKVFIKGLGVHRHGDARKCGASTVVSGQTKVSIG